MAIIRHVRQVVIVTAFMMCAILAGAVATAQTSFATIDGEIGPGALYRILVPTAVPWNGELVVFLQGISDPADAIGLSGPGVLGQPTLQFKQTAKLEAATNAEIVSAGMTVIGFGVRQFNDLLDVTHGHMPYDNSDPRTMYVGSADDAALNDGVARFTGDPSALEYMEHYATPTGNLLVPVITLHRTRDPLVPRLLHEDAYATSVQNAGASQYLLQRTVGGFGHCGFPNDELTAFSALVQWVHTGVRPQ